MFVTYSRPLYNKTVTNKLESSLKYFEYLTVTQSSIRNKEEVTGMLCRCFLRYDRHYGSYALRRSIRWFFISSCSRGNDGLPGYR